MIKKYETLNKQTHTKPQTFEFEITKPREFFSFKPSNELGFASNWIVGLISLEIYNSFFNITEGKNKFELYPDTFD